jgi:hypothetical protein
MPSSPSVFQRGFAFPWIIEGAFERQKPVLAIDQKILFRRPGAILLVIRRPEHQAVLQPVLPDVLGELVQLGVAHHREQAGGRVHPHLAIGNFNGRLGDRGFAGHAFPWGSRLQISRSPPGISLARA